MVPRNTEKMNNEALLCQASNEVMITVFHSASARRLINLEANSYVLFYDVYTDIVFVFQTQKSTYSCSKSGQFDYVAVKK